MILTQKAYSTIGDYSYTRPLLTRIVVLLKKIRKNYTILYIHPQTQHKQDRLQIGHNQTINTYYYTIIYYNSNNILLLLFLVMCIIVQLFHCATILP